jgi:hypothetical protein
VAQACFPTVATETAGRGRRSHRTSGPHVSLLQHKLNYVRFPRTVQVPSLLEEISKRAAYLSFVLCRSTVAGAGLIASDCGPEASQQ